MDMPMKTVGRNGQEILIKTQTGRYKDLELETGHIGIQSTFGETF